MIVWINEELEAFLLAFYRQLPRGQHNERTGTLSQVANDGCFDVKAGHRFLPLEPDGRMALRPGRLAGPRRDGPEAERSGGEGDGVFYLEETAGSPEDEQRVRS